MDRNILRQYLSGLAGANNRFLLENSRYLGNLPQNIVYNGLLYTLNLRENAFINQFGHRIDASSAPAFITEARAFEQQNLAILDISSSSSDNSSSRPQPAQDLPANINEPRGEIDPSRPNSAIILTWNIDISQQNNVDTFIVLRSTDPKGPFTEVKTSIPKGARATFDEGLSSNTIYYYQIESVYKSNKGTPSTIISVKTAAGGASPTGITAPSGLTALNISQTGLNLRWVDNSTNEIGFFVEESVSGSTFTLIEAVGVGVTFVGVKGLTQDTNYSFRVQAYGTGSTSGFSTVSTRTLPTLPAAPTSLSLLVGGTSQIALSWTDNSTNEQYFNIFRTTDGGASYVLGATVGANSTAYIATGLSAGTTYGFRVNAANTGGTSGFAGPEFAQTLPIAPSTPAFTSISGTTNSITLNWSDVANETGYGLYRSVDNGASYPLLVTLAANTTTYTNTSLSSGTTYFYKLDAFNAGGTSALSGATSFTTQGVVAAPAAPTALAAYSLVPATKNYLRSTQGFTSSIWQGTSTTVTIDNSILAPDGSTGAALLTVTSPATIGGINTTITEPGVTASDYWSGSVWLRGKTATCGGINIVIRDAANNQLVIPSTLKVLSGPGTLVPSSVGEAHWNGITGLSKTEWTRIAWNNFAPWGPTGLPGTYTGAIVRLTVNFYDGAVPSAVTGDSIYVWGAQYERNPYPTEYLAATGTTFSERAFQGFTSQANLYWTDNSNNETGFLIERSVNDVTYAGITSVAANTTIYSDRGLSAGSTYFYRVSAFNAGGTSATTKSPSVTTYPIIVAPTAPSNLRFLSRTQTGFTMAWNDNSNNETGFILQSSTSGITYSTVANLAAGITTAGVTGLTAGATYFFQVGAYNSGGTSFSGATSWLTLRNPPASPFLSSITPGITSISLSWSDVANETGYNIYRSLDNVTFTGITTLSANTTTFVDRGLTSNTVYWYNMDAFNEGGTSSRSFTSSVKTLPNTPIAPSNLRFIERTTTILSMSWNDNSTNELGFLVQSSSTGGSYTTFDTVGAGTTNYTAVGLSSGTTYFFRIGAFADGTTAFSGGTSWRTLPTVPTNFTATAGTTSSINLAWTDVTGEDGYVLNRGLTSAFTTFTGITLAANATGYSDIGLSAGTTYWYRLYAFLNDGGTSGFAGPTFATTIIAGTTPSAPTGFTAIDAGTNSVTLQWTDTATNEDGFLIYYRGLS